MQTVRFPFPDCRIWLPVEIETIPLPLFLDCSTEKYVTVTNFFLLLPTADYDCPWQLQAIPFFVFFLTAIWRNTWHLQSSFFSDSRIWMPVTITNHPFPAFFWLQYRKIIMWQLQTTPPHFYFFFMTTVERHTWQLEWREIFTAVAVEDAREVLSIKGCTLRTSHRVLNVFALHRLNAVEKLPAVVTVFENAATQSGATLRGEVDYLSLGCRSWKRNGEC